MSTTAFAAVKGLGHWADLRDNPGTTERFIIGTLASTTWAGVRGVLGSALLERVVTWSRQRRSGCPRGRIGDGPDAGRPSVLR